MNAEKNMDFKGKHKPKKRLILNSSGKLMSKLIPWNVGLSIAEPIARLFEPPQKLVGPYVKRGQVVADLGCGRGYYTLALAKLVGADVKVHAVDLNKNNVRALQKRADKAGYHNIEAHNSSASDLSFITDKSVDFILANGLLWSMATDRQLSVKEMKRILKPDGQIYMSLGAGPPFGYVDQSEWENILEEFTIRRGGSYQQKWALLSLKQV